MTLYRGPKVKVCRSMSPPTVVVRCTSAGNIVTATTISLACIPSRALQVWSDSWMHAGQQEL